MGHFYNTYYTSRLKIKFKVDSFLLCFPVWIVTNARAGFMAGKTRTKEARRRNLEGILQLIKNHSDDMIEAQRKDLHKPSFETIIGEVEMAKAEATDFLQRLDEIMGKTDVWICTIILGITDATNRVGVIHVPLCGQGRLPRLNLLYIW
ncbi:hypothetical protein BSL78_25029 [Apostichopus japonicus]|uniref:Uncharacterized protein n=1 Tax=Stichopus japonicus TaxID=307972 RepID=A0A2G8JQU6_STIJA|nr:hypothetical protein BSL78_25029 [Apostichopus japonicus]